MTLEKQSSSPDQKAISLNNIYESIKERSAALKYTSAGALLGLSWAAALRAWMVLLALEFGDQPRVTWVNTFVVILLASAMVGAILGTAEFIRRTTGNPRWRWAALAPLILVIYPLLFMDGFIETLLSTGEGGGAISVTLAGIFGGYAIAEGGRRWLRLLTSLLFLVTVLGTVVALHLNGIFDGRMPTAAQSFNALYFTLLMLLFAAGASIPFRIQSHKA